ncbi:MAG: FxsA family protein [Lentisphaeria bacterium]|nr:FxsA family protein [Lentisphaeria bacterium]
MFLKLCLLFVVLPCAELALLGLVGQRIGLAPTLGIILLTGVLGAWLARRQGAQAWRNVHRAVAEGRLPTGELLEALLVFAAGLLLLTPGLLTDSAGLALLIPVCRMRVRRALARRLGSYVQAHAHDVHRAPGDSMRQDDPYTVEGRALRVEDADD